MEVSEAFGLPQKMNPRHAKCCACFAKWSSCTNVPSQKWRPLQKPRLSSLSQYRPSSPNIAPSAKQDLTTSHSAHACQVVARAQTILCHTDEKCLEPIVSKGGQDIINMAPMSHACHEKRLGFKNRQAALVKVDLGRNKTTASFFVRGSAVEMRKGTFVWAGAVKTRGAKREPWLPQEPWVWTHCVGLIFKGWGSDREVAKRSQWQLSAGPRYHRMMHDVQPGTGTVATVSTAPGTLGTVGNWSDDWSVMKRMTRWMGAGTLPKLQARKPRRHRWTALPFPQRAIVPGDYTSECKS